LSRVSLKKKGGIFALGSVPKNMLRHAGDVHPKLFASWASNHREQSSTPVRTADNVDGCLLPLDIRYVGLLGKQVVNAELNTIQWNRITSRKLAASVEIVTSRSKPRASPTLLGNLGRFLRRCAIRFWRGFCIDDQT
jgi:hypothetical protein